MASSHIMMIIAIVVAISGPAMATEFMVGDKSGWTTNFDYQAWAQGKEFHVGDKLGALIFLIHQVKYSVCIIVLFTVSRILFTNL